MLLLVEVVDQLDRLGLGKVLAKISQRLGNVQKCLHGLTQKGSLATSHTSDRDGTFSEVTGGRAPSFLRLICGGSPGPERMRGERWRGQVSLADKS
jgi:hypothetical protein